MIQSPSWLRVFCRLRLDADGRSDIPEGSRLPLWGLRGVEYNRRICRSIGLLMLLV